MAVRASKAFAILQPIPFTEINLRKKALSTALLEAKHIVCDTLAVFILQSRGNARGLAN